MKRLSLAAALMLALAACKGADGDPVATSTVAIHPESRLPVIPVTISHAGKVIRIKAELASTSAEQAKGLMFRTALGADEGMLFPFDPPKQASFWMKNTVIPLDLVFVAADGRVTNIAANAQPYDESPLKSAGPVKAVLELPGGRTAELEIAAGDKVEW